MLPKRSSVPFLKADSVEQCYLTVGGMQFSLLLAHPSELRLVSCLLRETQPRSTPLLQKIAGKQWWVKYERTPSTQKHREQWLWSSSKCLHPKARLCDFPQVYKLSLKFQVRSHNWFINIQLDALGDSTNKQTGNIAV